ncbi:hypothetical protein FDECE_11449 [Fusarium decemcellulare]|nr:hypothetical protein FDECE_11449 [Fusarium decemcellulare]
MAIHSTKPSSSPPRSSATGLAWVCKHCGITYKIAVTRRCLKCFATTKIGPSTTPAYKRRRRLERYAKMPSIAHMDYEHWTIYNDWRRFRASYSADPAAWKSRTKRELRGAEGKERQALKDELEMTRRIEITEERKKRFANGTWSCEKDCDYLSQCAHERYEAKHNGVAVVGSVIKPAIDDIVNVDPTCALLPEPKVEVADPEAIYDDDEIIMAYEARDQYDWFTKTQDDADLNDDEEAKLSDETEEA